MHPASLFGLARNSDAGQCNGKCHQLFPHHLAAKVFGRGAPEVALG